MKRFVVISGCSGGGKSTLLTELAERGHEIVNEPGRRIVKNELAAGGSTLPWTDPAAFARRAIGLALADYAAATQLGGWVFFDRGLIDAAAAVEHLTGEPTLVSLGSTYRYYDRVFVAPPWREIYITDSQRRHGFDDAVAEFERLIEVYPSLGYDVVVLPKVGTAERADFIMRVLNT
jgi:predicted ATPase